MTQSILISSAQTGPVTSSPAQVRTEENQMPLTRLEAEKLALANNPRIRISALIARVQHQAARERRADELPNLSGNLTAVEANDGSRISSGSLTASRLVEHAGMGVQLSQLITDFGHTRNLVASAKLQEKARLADAEASRLDILLATDQVFFAVIEAQDTLKVAMQTVNARQALVDQVGAFTKAKLKSDLDESFARVNLSQAKLLQLNAQNNLDAAKAAFSAVLGYDKEMNFQLVDDSASLPTVPPDADALIAQAIQNRPDLRSFKYSEQAAQKFSKAQHEQLLPTISALGVVGGTPVGSSQYITTNWYGAVGGNVSIPIFNGFRLSAQASEASLESKEATEQTRALLDQVVRDVRTAWLNSNTALQRVTVTAELLKEANTALDLAKTRYDLGLSSIVELSQAELQQTEAAIGNANARSQYSLAISTINFQTCIQP
ncbi:TolC family protein [Granulicella sp. dw_53]|uniref:TolC family protein n=1 Tax=Granulicella sp. dw_53 TaxID=2719792 RepID=UPI001BD3C5AD|nr:TolC family protein [Granulicella sp. dw_53]